MSYFDEMKKTYVNERNQRGATGNLNELKINYESRGTFSFNFFSDGLSEPPFFIFHQRVHNQLALKSFESIPFKICTNVSELWNKLSSLIFELQLKTILQHLLGRKYGVHIISDNMRNDPAFICSQHGQHIGYVIMASYMTCTLEYERDISQKRSKEWVDYVDATSLLNIMDEFFELDKYHKIYAREKLRDGIRRTIKALHNPPEPVNDFSPSGRPSAGAQGAAAASHTPQTPSEGE